MPDCLVCQELRGEVAVPGDFLLENAVAVVFHVPPLEQNPQPYLGHLLVVTRRHVAGLGDLSDAESAAIGRLASQAAKLLIEKAGAEWVYAAVIGTGVPHFHQHLLPRYPGTPPTVRWHSLDEWDGGRHGGAVEIATFLNKIRG